MQEHVTVHEPIARYQYHFVKLIFSVGSGMSTLAALAAVLLISSLLQFIAGFSLACVLSWVYISKAQYVVFFGHGYSLTHSLSYYVCVN